MKKFHTPIIKSAIAVINKIATTTIPKKTFKIVKRLENNDFSLYNIFNKYFLE